MTTPAEQYMEAVRAFASASRSLTRSYLLVPVEQRPQVSTPDEVARHHLPLLPPQIFPSGVTEEDRAEVYRRWAMTDAELKELGG